MEYEKSCGVIIYRAGRKRKYLLLQYDAGHWDFVKGNVEKNETEAETAIREANEETGIDDLKFLDGFKEKISYFYRRRQLISKTVVFFLAATRKKDVKLSFEHKEFKWADCESAMKLLTYPNAKRILEKAEYYMKKRFVQKLGKN